MDDLRAPLSHISPDDRDTWVRMGMAIKSALGEGGFDLWNEWSAQSPRYNARDAKTVWRSISRDGGITIATMYKEARDNGWRGEEVVVPPPKSAPKRDLEKEARHNRAAQVASEILRKATMEPSHPYLEEKGFPNYPSLVDDDGNLLVPMLGPGRTVRSVQMIAPDGTKKFLPGGRASGSHFPMGQGERWLCEGYATGLAVKEALKSVYRTRTCVVVCFSASNLTKVFGGFVVADNDRSKAGEEWARKTGLPFWMPPEVGTDANDYFMEHGPRKLGEELLKITR